MTPYQIEGLDFQESTRYWTVRVRFSDGSLGSTSLRETSFVDATATPLGQMLLLHWLSQATPDP